MRPPPHLARWLLLLPFVLLAALLLAYAVFTRHVPWEVPAHHRPPEAWTHPSVPGQGGLWVKALGVSGYEVSDGSTTLLLDPTPTRPAPFELLAGPLHPDEALGAAWCPRADALLVNHAHHDHALDVPAIARRTGALVVGSQNLVNLALSRGVPGARTRAVHGGEDFTVGTFRVRVRKGRHTHIAGMSNPMSGVIPPDAGPLWFWQYALDDALGYHLESTTNGAKLWFHPTSTWAPGELEGLEAETLVVGVTGEPQTVEKVRGLMSESRARRVLPTHFDNFFQPLSRGLALMPGLDLDAARSLFLAEAPGVEWGVVPAGERVFLPR